MEGANVRGFTLRNAALVAGIGLLAACGEDDGGDGQGDFKAMTMNLYIGFGQDVLSGDLTDPEALEAALQQALATFQVTDAPARLAAVGRLIANEDPDSVGLQEVVSIVLTRGPGSADDVPFVDFLGELQDRIASAGGAQYASFVHVNNTVEGTVDLLGRLEPFRFEESDVILVRQGLQAQAVGAGIIYSDLLPIGPILTPDGVQQRSFIRGAHHVRVNREGQSFELFNTHLEVNGENNEGTPFQNEQARELVTYIAGETAATAAGVILTGDMNARPGSVTHGVLTGAGFQDTFAQAGSGDGNTCCQTDDLQNTTSTASERIDYVFCKGGTSLCDPASSQVVLNQRVQGTTGSSQIWPSDHFGVLSELAFP